MEYTILIFSFASIAFFIYKFSVRNLNYWKTRKVPYIKPFPLVGNVWDLIIFRIPLFLFLCKLYNKMQTPYFGIYLFNKPCLIIRDPEIIKTVLVKDFNYFCDHIILSDEKCDAIVSKMLFAINSKQWKTLRAKMTPIFTISKLKEMLTLIEEVAEDMLKYLQDTKGSIDLKELSTRYMTDVIALCTFGVKAKSFEHEDAEFRNIGRKMMQFNLTNAFRQFTYFMFHDVVKLLKFTFFDPVVYKFFKNVFVEIVEERKRTNKRSFDLIDIIIQASKENNVEIENNTNVAQTLIFFLGGSETCSTTMGFSLYELGLQPTIQRKLQEEIKQAIQLDKDLNYKTILNLKYLHMVVCETLRKYPPVPFLDRVCTTSYRLPGSDFIVEKGTPILISLVGLHTDPKYFPNPEKFDPERFSDENKTSIPHFAFLAFGEGPRNCIGQMFGLLSLKLGLIRILLKYNVEVCAETPTALKFKTKSLIIAPTVKLRVKLRKII